MSAFDPANQTRVSDIFSVSSAEQLTKLQIPVIVDLDSEAKVIGCEIINLKFKAGETCADFLQELPSAHHVFPRFSYDPQVDACYLQLKDGIAARTESLDATAMLDPQGRIVRLSI